jgi:hypothetical protein
VTYPIPIFPRRRPQPAGTLESGFVLILVLPVAMLLMMTALSLVSRSNSAAVASTQESRAQAARMAAEYGFNRMMALINNQYDSSLSPTLVIDPNQVIAGSPATSYTITYEDPPGPVPTCSNLDSDNTDLKVYVEGKVVAGSTYRRNISRILKVCNPSGTTNLRVRAFR